MASKREFTVEVVEDGKLRVEMGDMSGPHHQSADDFLKILAEVMGGEVSVKSTKGKAHHHHHGEGRSTAGHSHA